ncbi:hypothetical protein IV203_013208 [Nitzschia inconspicua]|uniref:Uncharacterized protein n=1 Tax=Nitzschia inconspicua TaxID=303405 RepID=A0A9K3Q7W3_9STRA|nr:hypothetical protein IV203_013208 [Nitzschia inconspicua]
MPQNSIEHPENYALRQSLEEIKSIARKNVNVQQVADIAPQTSIQLWKVEEGLEIGSSTFVPMAPPISLGAETNVKGYKDGTDRTIMSAPPSFDDELLKPIDRVAHATLYAGCDACIVSSHREEIRDLYKHRCGYKNVLHQEIPFGCIGVFEAYLEDVWTKGIGSFHQPVSPIQWIFYGMFAPGQMPNDILQDIVSISQPVVENDKIFPISYPVIERTTVYLCEATLVIDCLSLPHCITRIISLSINGMHPSQTQNKLQTFNCTGVDLNLQITRGHHSWLDFLRRLHVDDAHGVIEYVQNKSLKNSKVVIRPSRQALLPCPPKTILIEVEGVDE